MNYDIKCLSKHQTNWDVSRYVPSHLEVALTIPNPEVAVHESYDPLLETAGKHSYDKVPLSAWEAALKGDINPWSGKVAATACEEASAEQKRRETESHHTKENDLMAQEVKFAVIKLISNEMETMVEEALQDVLFKNSITQKVVSHLMLTPSSSR